MYLMGNFNNYDNGQKKFECKGNVYTRYYENGKIKYCGKYTLNQLNGPCKMYDEEENVTYDGNMINHKRNGQGKSYCNGKLSYDGFWNEGEACLLGKLYANDELIEKEYLC
jgi:antitoxin component YwqK of YwqJK toxin-antitoxin module